MSGGNVPLGGEVWFFWVGSGSFAVGELFLKCSFGMGEMVFFGVEEVFLWVGSVCFFCGGSVPLELGKWGFLGWEKCFSGWEVVLVFLGGGGSVPLGVREVVLFFVGEMCLW